MKSILCFLFTLCFAFSVRAQSPDNIQGEAAFLFAYYPKEGKQQKFEEGYKNHLQWHQNNEDPLPWYGWYVVTGERIGMFVDGTFGISFEAFDNRIAPTEDAGDFSETTAPYADAAYRSVFKLKPELSTSTLLEDRNPSPTIEAYTFSVMPGSEAEFEEVIFKLVSAMKQDEPEQEFTFYKLLTGGNLPAYLLIVPQHGFADFASGKSITAPGELIPHLFDNSTAKNLLDQFSDSVRKIYGETWSYRSDLSYFPGQR